MQISTQRPTCKKIRSKNREREWGGIMDADGDAVAAAAAAEHEVMMRKPP